MHLVHPAGRALLAAVVLQSLAAALTVVPLVAIVRFADSRLASTAETRATAADTTDIGALVVTVVAASLLSILLSTAATLLSHRADSTVQLALRRDLVRAMTRLPLSVITGRGSGRIAAAVKDDVAALHYLVAHTVLDLATVIVGPLAGFIALAVIDLRLAGVALVPFVLGAFFFVRAMSGSQTNFAKYTEAQGDINAASVDYVTGMPSAKVYNGTQSAREAFIATTNAFHDFFRSWSSSTSVATTASWLVVTPAVTVTAFLVGGALATSTGWAAPDALVALVLIGPAIAAPVAVVGPRVQALSVGLAAASSITSILDERQLEWGDGSARPSGYAVRFENVDFSYDHGPDATPTVHSISFELPEGSTTAIVGPSGAGKSTIAGLLARFHEPTSGRILIGGVELGELSARQLYDHVGVVLQDTALRRRSIRDDLTGARDIPDEEVVSAARAAGIHEVIAGLPRAYDSILGEDVTPSGGQAQRLGIARMLLRDCPVVVLDEPTSAMDAETQQAVRAGIDLATRGRTTLVVAHRLSTVTHADQILVLERGVITERGTHADLLALDGTYRRLWNTQHPRTELA